MCVCCMKSGTCVKGFILSPGVVRGIVLRLDVGGGICTEFKVLAEVFVLRPGVGGGICVESKCW
jgi:hypothetical protein